MEKTLRIVWIAFFAAMFVYVIVAYFVADPGRPPLEPFLIYAIVLLAILNAGLSILLPRVLSLSLTDNGEPLPPAEAQQKHTTRAIMSWATAESVVILGLVLVVLSGRFYWIFPFWTSGVVLMILHSSLIRDEPQDR